MKKLLTLLFIILIAGVLTACKKNTSVIIETSAGSITVELFDKDTPVTVKNFLAYANAGFYDGTIFHRVIDNFMIQGGGFTPEMTQKEPLFPPIKNEADKGLKNARGTIAMARTADVHSATSQFFINVRDNVYLDHGTRDFGYCVFGKVTSGMDVVDKIKSVETHRVNGFTDVPVETVTILSVKTDK